MLSGDGTQNAANNLSSECFGNYTTSYRWEIAIANGTIVEVTSLVSPEFGFGITGKVRVALTFKLWDTLLQAITVPHAHITFCGCRNDVLRLASIAAVHAKEFGSNTSTLRLEFPGLDQKYQTLRVEIDQSKEIPQVTIGFPDDFALF